MGKTSGTYKSQMSVNYSLAEELHYLLELDYINLRKPPITIHDWHLLMADDE